MNITNFAQTGEVVLPAVHWNAVLQGDITLDSLTSYIHHHTDIRFSFNSRKIKGNSIVAFTKGAYDLSGLLRHIRKSTGLYYFAYGWHVIFQDNPRNHGHAADLPSVRGHSPGIHSGIHPLAPKQDSSAYSSLPPLSQLAVIPHVDQGYLPDTSGVRGVDSALAGVRGTDVALDNARGTEASDSILRFKWPPWRIGWSGRFGLFGEDTVKINKADTADGAVAGRAVGKGRRKSSDDVPAARRERRVAARSTYTSTRGASGSDWYMQAGIFASEALYVNPAIEAGIRPIHLLISGASDFQANGWRIGLGSIIVDEGDRQWQLMATFCPLKTTYPIDSGLHVLHFSVKGQLYNAGVAWCKRIADTHLLFKIGAGLNVLHTTYYKDGVPTAPGKYFTSRQNPDTQLYLVHPPWMISNTFENNTKDNNKIWVGLSVGLYYDLKF